MNGTISGEAAAEGTPAPLTGGLLLGFLVAAAARLPYDVQVFGAAHIAEARGALVVSNHRRDSDGPLLGGLLLERHRLTVRGVAPYFVAREDLFRPGFLGLYLQGWPRPLRTLLARLRLGGVLRALQLRPMRRIPEHSLGELLADVRQVLGDVALGEVLRAPWPARFAEALGLPAAALSVNDALAAPPALLYRRHAFLRMRLDAFRRLVPFERAVIGRQLGTFVRLLDAGAAVVLEPEGQVSADGRFHDARGALHHLLNAPRRPPPVVPVAFSYDFLRPGRPRVLVRFGGALHGLAGRPRPEADARVQRALLALWTVNASHLAARFLGALRDRPAPRSRIETRLARYLAAAAGRCRDQGVPVDPALLEPGAAEKRAHQCLRVLGRRCPRGHTGYARGEDCRAYLDNELSAVLSLHPHVLDGLAP